MAMHHRVLSWPGVGGGSRQVWSCPLLGARPVLSHDGGRLAGLGETKGVVNVYHLGEQRVQSEPGQCLTHPGRAYALAFSPDGTRLAVAAGHSVAVWETAGWTRERTLEGHSRSVGAVTFSPDGRLLLSGSDDRTVRLWSVATGARKAALDWGVGKVSSVRFAPDGMRAAAGGGDGTIVVWDIDEGA